MPSLTDVYLPYAFLYKDVLSMNGDKRSHVWLIDVGALEDHPNLMTTVTVSTVAQWNYIPTSINRIIISSNSLNVNSFTTMDFSDYSSLKMIEIGDECGMYVTRVEITGLNSLKSVRIGENSFTTYKGSYPWEGDESGIFQLKNCPKVKSLQIGLFSFSSYKQCLIANVGTLESIKMGDWDNIASNSNNFRYASLELRSMWTALQ